MSHTSFVQQVAHADIRDELDSCPISGSLLSIGLMGGEGQYTMPRAILEALAEHQGGMVMNDLPPFFVACRDGLVLVLTVAVGAEFMGCAFLLPSDRLASIDRQLKAIWGCASKEQTAAELFEGTAFAAAGIASPIPESVGECWSKAFS